MKTLFKKIWAVTALLGLMVAPALAQGRIATVNMTKVFDNYYKKDQAQAAYDQRRSDFEKERKGMIDDYNKARDEYNSLLESANDPGVTPETRDKRKAAAEDKLRDLKTQENTIQTFNGTMEDELLSEKKRMMDGLVQAIRVAVTAKAKAAGYSMVIDSSAEGPNGVPILLYNSGENDLTDGVLTQLNVGAPSASDGSKPAPRPDDKK